jgi:hypothetical protein
VEKEGLLQELRQIRNEQGEKAARKARLHLHLKEMEEEMDPEVKRRKEARPHLNYIEARAHLTSTR